MKPSGLNRKLLAVITNNALSAPGQKKSQSPTVIKKHGAALTDGNKDDNTNDVI